MERLGPRVRDSHTCARSYLSGFPGLICNLLGYYIVIAPSPTRLASVRHLLSPESLGYGVSTIYCPGSIFLHSLETLLRFLLPFVVELHVVASWIQDQFSRGFRNGHPSYSSPLSHCIPE